MPKIIEYPRASFSRVMDMASSIDYLGGSCSFQSCADQMGIKVSGAFTALVGAAKKHELIDTKNKILSTTELYQNIRLAYTEDERRSNLRKSFLAPPLYTKIYEKFKGKELPVPMLAKLFVREYEVDKDLASRLSNYFVEGAEFCELLIDNKIVDIDQPEIIKQAFEIKPSKIENIEYKVSPIINDVSEEITELKGKIHNFSISEDNYYIRIVGPGMDSKITISEEDDFLILEAMIKKLKKSIKRN